MNRYRILVLTVGGWAPAGDVMAKDEGEAYRLALREMDKLPKERVKVEKVP